MACVWYVSKYVTLPKVGDPLGRGYAIMKEIADMGHTSVMVMSDSMGKLDAPPAPTAYSIEKADGMTLAWVRTIKYSSSKSARRIASWMDFERALLSLPVGELPKPDVVIVSSPSLFTILNGFRLRRKFKARLVFEIRDIWPLTLTEEGGFSDKNLLVRVLAAIEQLGYRRADTIVGTMPNLGEHVKKVTGEDIPAFCIPMGMDTDSYTGDEELDDEFAQKYLPHDKFVVGYTGSLGIGNALEPLFECIASMQDVLDVHFLIVGTGELREHYRSKYGHLGNLTFAPWIRKSQVHAVLLACDLLCLSVHQSVVWDYGLSHNKLIDYMASGKPIVALFSGYPSMINEAECGTFVQAGDVEALRAEILRYRDMDPREREAIGQRGRQWLLANRTFKVLAQQYLEVMGISQ